MDLQKIIAELEAERDRLDEAILALERLSTATPGKRRLRFAETGEREINADGSSDGTELLSAKAANTQ